jgi:hypothetical protein
MSIAEGINLYSILYSISYYKSSLGIMAYNVPAVYDVFVARISKTARFCRATKMWRSFGVGMAKP